MLRKEFKTKLEFDIYLAEQKIRKEKGYLTVSERNQLESMLSKDYKPVFIKEEKPKPLIVTNLKELKIPCQEVTKEDNVKEIIEKLKNTLECYDGLGLSANQIGIQKRISYIKIPIYNPKDKKMNMRELILINPLILEKDKAIKFTNEGCLSFPRIYVTTKRYIYCTVQYLDENFKETAMAFQDLESFVVQHEVDHLGGRTIFDRKWRSK